MENALEDFVHHCRIERPATASPNTLALRSNLRPVPGAVLEGTPRPCSDEEALKVKNFAAAIESRTSQVETAHSTKQFIAETEAIIAEMPWQTPNAPSE